MRVVFDTNIFISALVFPGASAEQALIRVFEGRDRLIVSKPIIKELLGVLSKKFGRDREELAHTAVFLTELGELVSPRRKLAILQDEPDNRILECAITGRAEMIITGDREMLKLGEYQQIKIITLREYLTLHSSAT